MPALTLVPSAARTATGNTVLGATFSNKYSKLRVELRVSAASGTSPTLDVKLQDSFDGGTNWNDVTGGSFTQKTTTGAQVVDVTGQFGGLVRVLYTIGGTTPSFTFAVKGMARA